MKVGSLFAGIGGFDLGLERAGFEIAWQVEIDEYCRRVLAKHWPGVTRYGDIRAIDWDTVSRVDLLCGGFPCQDLSFAGKRAGIDGERSGLWGEYVRAICALRPRYILVENVPGLLTNEYMGRVLGDLAASGYDAEWDCLPASAFGARHIRGRMYLIATAESMDYANCLDARSFVRQAPALRRWSENHSIRSCFDGGAWPREPAFPRVAHGVPHRVDRLRGLGNAIVPQIAEWLGRQIMKVTR